MKIFKRIAFVFVAAVTLFGATLGLANAFAKGEAVTTVEIKTGVTVQKNDKAEVDVSNLTEGFVLIKYKGGKDVRIKVQIAKTGGTTYTYDINNKGNSETMPLTEGDGKYKITVLENTTGNKYATAFSCEVDLKLRDQFLPFLYPNQYVNFNSNSKVVSKAKELVSSSDTSLQKLEKIYNFVVDNFTYDNDRAAKVQAGTLTGYLPDVDAVLAAKKGICFDYAAVMAAMLRSQGIPCKLVIGYTGTTYHAWINVYIDGEGWIDSAIKFDGKNWTLMDPTFVSSSKRSGEVMKYVTNKDNYTQKFAY